MTYSMHGYSLHMGNQLVKHDTLLLSMIKPN